MHYAVALLSILVVQFGSGHVRAEKNVFSKNQLLGSYISVLSRKTDDGRRHTVVPLHQIVIKTGFVHLVRKSKLISDYSNKFYRQPSRLDVTDLVTYGRFSNLAIRYSLAHNKRSFGFWANSETEWICCRRVKSGNEVFQHDLLSRHFFLLCVKKCLWEYPQRWRVPDVLHVILEGKTCAIGSVRQWTCYGHVDRNPWPLREVEGLRCNDGLLTRSVSSDFSGLKLPSRQPHLIADKSYRERSGDGLCDCGHDKPDVETGYPILDCPGCTLTRTFALIAVAGAGLAQGCSTLLDRPC